jgi:hypothetical protein
LSSAAPGGAGGATGSSHPIAQQLFHESLFINGIGANNAQSQLASIKATMPHEMVIWQQSYIVFSGIVGVKSMAPIRLHTLDQSGRCR